jgi:NitT/TauT family transport system ATP-binding protein
VLRDLWEAHHFTVVLVTHDLREAAFLADTVYVMSRRPGRIVERRRIDLPRPRELAVTYEAPFITLVQELRAQIGEIRST